MPNNIINILTFDNNENKTILEPSAGQGHLLDRLKDEFANTKLLVVENNPMHVQRLHQKGYDVIEDDFMNIKPIPVNGVFMNPPFTYDTEHIKHAYDFLQDEGSMLVSVAGAGIKFNSTKKHIEFREWLKSVNAEINKLEMVNPLDAKFSVTEQCELLSLNRTSLYYKPAPTSDTKLKIFSRIDEIYTEDPSFGGATIGTILRREGLSISDPTVRKYMSEMGLQAIYPKSNLSKRAHESLIYPYLLRNVTVKYRDHVWGTDITYIRLQKGFLYLVAYMDWFSRYVLSWELCDNMEVGFVIEALEAALKISTPEIVNSDQGSQFTANKHTSLLLANDVKISMDGRGRCLDNVFTERLWRNLKYQEVYLTEYKNPREARAGISRYFHKYNTYRPHQGINGLTPYEVYNGNFTCFDFQS
jgi:putative transposase